MRALARADAPVVADYGATRGAHGLRRLLLARLGAEGLEVGPDQLMLTASGTQAIDLVCRFLLRLGDTVLVDDPCYFHFRALLKAHRARMLGIPYTPSGPDAARFEAVVAAERPRLYVTNSALHNPTGATPSTRTAHRLLNAAAAHDVIILEDDIFADFDPEPSVRLAALDGLDRVIRLGSFSKTLSASVRCGYIAARRDWIEGLVDLQVATSFGGPSPVATTLIADLPAGAANAATSTRCTVGWPGRAATSGETAASGPRAVADAARRPLPLVPVAAGLRLAAGTAAAFMRFNVAQCGDARMWSVLRRAIDAAARPDA